MSNRKRKRRRRRPAGTGPQPNPRAGGTGTQPARGAEPEPGPDSAAHGVADADAARAGSRRRGGGREAPPPPWGSFPLSELTIAIALLLIVGGFFVSPPRGTAMFVVGVVLGSLAGLELAAREHFAGYRSHTLVMSSAIGVAVLVALVLLADLKPVIALAAGAVAFGVAAYFFSQAFKRRSGGVAFKIRLRP